MATGRHLPDSVVWKSVRALVAHGDQVNAARAMGISRGTLTHHIAMARQRWPSLVKTPNRATPGWAKSVKLPAKMPPSIPPTTRVGNLPDERTDEERIKDLRQRAEEAGVAERLARAERRVMTLEDENATIRKLKSLVLDPVKWSAAPQVGRRTVLMPLLFTSDFHVGEKVSADELDGMNAYDMNIFAERYQRLIERTIDISDHHAGPASFPGVFYLRGGDFVSNGIHEELAETNDLSAVPAGKWLLRHEREGIKRLRARFGRVHVISIPGNHDRDTPKPRSSGYALHSYATMLTWWLASMFESDPKVTFHTPMSGDAWFEVMGHAFLLSHGDRMGSRGGQGFIGPAATIARGHQKLYANWTQTGRRVDVILTGHLHASMKLDHGFSNGSLPGYTPYARDYRAKPDAAKQWLLYVHEKRGVALPFEVQVSDKPVRRAYSPDA